MSTSNGTMPSVNLRVELIGPEKAREYLALNKRNRPIKVTATARYADLMRRGEWKLTNDALVLDPDQFNGQNRLTAVVDSDTEQWFVVAEGLPEGSTDGFDQGVRRSLADHLAMRGAADGRNLGATLWALMVLRRMWDGSSVNFEGGNWDERPTMSEVLAIADETFVADSLAVGNRFRGSSVRVAPSLIAAIHHELAQIDPEAAGIFFDRLLDGANLEPGNPIYRLRQSFINEAIAVNGGGIRRRSDRTLQAARILKAWNMWRRGRRDVQIVSWKRVAEDFPMPVERMTSEQLAAYIRTEQNYERRAAQTAKARESRYPAQEAVEA